MNRNHASRLALRFDARTLGHAAASRCADEMLVSSNDMIADAQLAGLARSFRLLVMIALRERAPERLSRTARDELASAIAVLADPQP